MPNERELAEAIWYVKDVLGMLDDYHDGYVDKIAVREGLEQVLEFLGDSHDEE